MAQNFKETAHLKTDTAKYSENLSKIVGEKKQFCDDCGFRFSFCKCATSKDQDPSSVEPSPCASEELLDSVIPVANAVASWLAPLIQPQS